jgi:hypothetical protein
MKLPYATPDPALSARARKAMERRHLLADIARIAPHAITEANGEEIDHGFVPTDRHGKPIGHARYPANFTKGLAHDEHGLLAHAEDYRAFVKAINVGEHDLFDTEMETAESRGTPFRCKIPKGRCLSKKELADKQAYNLPHWRGWESPRAGHAYELEGPDAGSVGMAPAPRVGSSELAAEMAELYAMAILRDVPFTVIGNGGKAKLCETKGDALLSSQQIVDLLNGMSFYSGVDLVSSTPEHVGDDKLNRFERDRRFARTGSLAGGLTTQNLFRGSSPGVTSGPYISQFMLVGSNSLSCRPEPASFDFPGLSSEFGLEQGFIAYGSQVVDQRSLVHKGCLDYMTCWHSWLDVQNGANLKKNVDQFEPERRFLTTPCDLATYVHFDALYQAYLNACLILLSYDAPTSKGFPEPSPGGRRTPFATFGGPHILSLVTEVATRCLKAVRRQKFNYHRRARPEALGGRLTLAKCDKSDKLGCAKEAFEATLREIPDDLPKAIIQHNHDQNAGAMVDMRRLHCPPEEPWKGFADCNLLLPMAFPEGSPMHPAYGAGHATVAGGCVTMLKAFFEMFEDCDSGKLRPLVFPCRKDVAWFAPNADGTKLEANLLDGTKTNQLTIQGELNKLAANIAIGRNMAGVHYYSDYYHSVRLGERVAVGILLEQSITYGDEVEMTFDSFDGDRLTISGKGGSCPSLTVLAADGTAIDPRDWWLRHVIGEAVVEDL